MGNLQRQIAAIKQQLALGTAETVARLKRHETDIDGLKGAMEKVQQAVEEVQQAVEEVQQAVGEVQQAVGEVQVGQRDLRQALEEQATTQQSALDQLLDLVAEDHQEIRDTLDQVLERLRKLEQDRPPAA